MPRIFLLSPASCGGRRAQMLLREEADFPLARAIRHQGGAPLGDVFAFLSGLYFRGKLAYARRFAEPPRGLPGVVVITSTRGLLEPDTRVTREDLLEFADGSIDVEDIRYADALRESGRRLARGGCEAVLLGSIATGKYLDVLDEVFGERLRIPPDFVGRGDMSRGGLMLRCADAGEELAYAHPADVPRRGKRPPKLPPLPA